MIRLFISQPMKDKTDKEIKEERERIINFFKNKFEDDIEVINSFFEFAPHDAKPLWFLGKSFQLLSTADIVVFAKGWENARGCKMEYKACKEYGIKLIDMNIY